MKTFTLLWKKWARPKFTNRIQIQTQGSVLHLCARDILGGWNEKSSPDAALGGFTTCSMHAVWACSVPIPREAKSDNFDTYSTDVAFSLLQHCWMGQKAETSWIPFAMLIPLLEPEALGSAWATAGKCHRSRALAWWWSSVCCPGNQGILWHVACLPPALYPFQGAHREWVQFSCLFSAKDARDLVKTKEFRIQLSTNITWTNGSGKVFLWFHICKALSINYLVYVKLSPASYPAIKEKFLFKHPACMTDIITTNSNSSTVKLPKGIFFHQI